MHALLQHLTAALLTAATAGASLGCRGEGVERDGHGPRAHVEVRPGSEGVAQAPNLDEDLAPRRESLDLLLELPYCEVRHRGLAIDTGSSLGDAHRSFNAGPFTDVVPTERAGHTSGAVHASRVDYDFWLDRSSDAVRVSFRVQGEGASLVTLLADDKRVGEARLKAQTSTVLEFGPIARELPPGRHTLTLRFSRRRAGGDEPLALLDWIRIYLPDNSEARYAAPTRADIVQDVELGGQPQRSLTLRDASSVRCGMFPGQGARVLMDVGYWGEGEGTVQVLAHFDYQKAVVLAERKVVGGERAKWSHLDLALDAVGQDLIALELIALQSSGSGRLVFAEPTLTRSLPRPLPIRARNVIVVVVSGLSRDLIPPWAERKGLDHLYALSDQAVNFDGYRVSSTLVGEVFASLLTGLPGSRHAMSHTAAKLSEAVPLVSHAMREVGGRSALFTNVPYSFDDFGFARDWSRFDQMSPVDDLSADEPLLRARQWLQAELAEAPDRKRLLVVHLRGGHPPFDVTPDEAKLLPPPEYGGILEPRRAAILLRQVRERDRSASRRLGPKDWERLLALQRLALEKQDPALGALLELLKAHGQWDDSLVVFMGDVSRGDPPRVPFEPYGELREDRLSPPLLVKLPGLEATAKRVDSPIGTIDVSRAIHGALELTLPGATAELDLASLAEGQSPLRSSGTVAIHPPYYVYTVDRFRLTGVLGEIPALCDLEVDPSCQQDLYEQAPFQMEWLWRHALRALQAGGALGPTDSGLAEIDEGTQAALSVFGL